MQTKTKTQNSQDWVQAHSSVGLERHGQFLLLSAQLHVPLVQVDGKAEDVVDFPRCDLQPFPSPTVPAAAP